MGRPIVDVTVAENLILELVADAATGLELVGVDETAPAGDDYSGSRAWVKMHPLAGTGGPEYRRLNSDDTAEERYALRLTVAAQRALTDPQLGGSGARINRDAALVRTALDGRGAEHAATGHRVQVGRVTQRPELTSEHDAHRVLALTATVTVYRDTAGDPVLSTAP
jgi:hypothetical protein